METARTLEFEQFGPDVHSRAQAIRQLIECGQPYTAGARVFSKTTVLASCQRIQEYCDAKRILASCGAPAYEKIFASKVLNRIYRRVLEAQSITAAQETVGGVQ